MIAYSSIKSLHLEISTRCNASCPLCPRNISGYDAELGYPIHDMSLKEAQQLFPPSFISQLSDILINGNFGDFVTARDCVKIVKYFTDNNPNVQILISTNAGARPNIWAELGQMSNVTIGFDIDGLADTHSMYRRNTDWDTVISNAKKFIDAGGNAVWRMIKFDHNQHQIEECRQLSKKLGFAEFNILDDGRDTGPVYNNKGDYQYKLGRDPNFENSPYPEKAVIWKEWGEVGSTPENRKKYYETIPIKNSVNCYSKQQQEIYVTATGEVYPCCWLGFYPKLEHKHSWQQDNFQLADMCKNNNALEVGLEKAVEWFSSIEASWHKKAYSEGRLFKCDEYCGKNH